MNASGRITLFAVGLIATFGAASYLGTSLGDRAPTVGPEDAHGDSGHMPHPTPTAGSADVVPGGLTAARDGYTLRVTSGELVPGQEAELRFVVEGPDGRPVTDYVATHTKALHLVIASRDLTHFEHLHPELTADGTWAVAVGVNRAGAYRVFADFQPAARAEPLTLGTDLLVAGQYAPAPLPPASATAVVDGYTATLDGRLQPGTSSTVTLSIEKDGAPVTDLEPYLAAYGHLVALRAGDLTYLHVHPEGAPGDGLTPAGPSVTFMVDVPDAGEYRLFLDFKHQGVVRTVAFTATAAPQSPGLPEHDHPASEQTH